MLHVGFPQFRDFQINGAGAGLPAPIAIAVSVVDTFLAALTEAGATKAFDFEIHKPLRGKADHLAQPVAIRALLNQVLKVDHGVGHRVGLQGCWHQQPQPNDDPR